MLRGPSNTLINVPICSTGGTLPHRGTSIPCFFLHPICPRSTTFSLSPSLPPSLPVVTQIRGPIAGPSSPLPTRVRAFIFIARRIQHFVLSPTRVELYCIRSVCVCAMARFLGAIGSPDALKSGAALAQTNHMYVCTANSAWRTLGHARVV